MVSHKSSVGRRILAVELVDEAGGSPRHRLAHLRVNKLQRARMGSGRAHPASSRVDDSASRLPAEDNMARARGARVRS